MSEDLTSNGFTFFRSYYDVIKTLEPKKFKQIVVAMCELALNNKEEDLEGVLAQYFILIKPNLLTNMKKRRGGKDGGRPPKNEDENKPKDKTIPETIGLNHTGNLSPQDKDKDKELDTDTDKKKDKEGMRKRFVAPTVEQVVDYFNMNGYTEEAARKAFAYYNEADWHDSKGDKVKNWKQKMRSVWFDDENKIVVKPAEKVELDWNGQPYQ